jgi:hypothetical protein
MPGSPLNRLEHHWPQTPVPYAPSAWERSTWRETAKSWDREIETFLGDHPKLTLAAAATIGLLLGWVMKRR